MHEFFYGGFNIFFAFIIFFLIELFEIISQKFAKINTKKQIVYGM